MSKRSLFRSLRLLVEFEEPFRTGVAFSQCSSQGGLLGETEADKMNAHEGGRDGGIL